MPVEGPTFFVSQVGVVDVPGPEEGSPRMYEGRVAVHNPNETVDSLGTLRSVYKDHTDSDPYQAVHGALQKAAREVDPTLPQADLLETTSSQASSGGYKAEATFQLGERVVPVEGFHPRSESSARLNAVVKGNQSLYTL